MANTLTTTPSTQPRTQKSLGKQATFDLDLASTTNNSMYSDVSPRTSSSKLASGGRSILAKLTSPLRSRARNVADFHIRPFEPHRQYSPGDIVKGLVVLTVVKPIRVTHLTVALHGFIRVLKSPVAPGETITSDPAVAITNSRRSQYAGNGHASLFHDEITLCGEGRLEPGIYEFEFNLEFPSKGLPSSIDVSSNALSRRTSAHSLYSSKEVLSPT
jgi:hypothetical protein